MTVLKIHLTYQCTAACDHCRFSCTPTAGPFLDTETALETARALQQTNGLDTVVILGGEPGLHPERTLSLTSSLRALGLQVRIESNASWATDDEHAQRFLGPLFDGRARPSCSVWMPFTSRMSHRSASAARCGSLASTAASTTSSRRTCWVRAAPTRWTCAPTHCWRNGRAIRVCTGARCSSWAEQPAGWLPGLARPRHPG